jgi:2-C-methyl-D-erythritol 2,4-cyclodiphosphate synthase
MHLVGHSDADVLLHAITDALLGAGSLGDIGEWFPDTDPAHRGRDSKTMLREVVRQITSDGYRIDHLDCIVFAEAPKLTLHKASMRQAIGLLLQIPEESVSIKAKTGEGVDAVGEGRAISAQAIVLLSGISD